MYIFQLAIHEQSTLFFGTARATLVVLSWLEFFYNHPNPLACEPQDVCAHAVQLFTFVYFD